MTIKCSRCHTQFESRDSNYFMYDCSRPLAYIKPTVDMCTDCLIKSLIDIDEATSEEKSNGPMPQMQTLLPHPRG